MEKHTIIIREVAEKIFSSDTRQEGINSFGYCSRVNGNATRL